MIAQFLYGGAGILLFALGLWSLLVHGPLLRKLIALNIMGAGVFHVFIAIAHRDEGVPPDPIPHALVLTGIVVAVSATALALALNSRLEQADAESASAPVTPKRPASRISTQPLTDPEHASTGATHQ